MACSRGVFTRDTSDLSLVFLAFPRMPVDFLTNDRAGATLRPLRRRAPTPRTSSVFPHWLHEFINMHGGYYFGLTEEVHRGELRALREPARRNSGAVIAPARRENTRFSFHCYSDPILPRPQDKNHREKRRRALEKDQQAPTRNLLAYKFARFWALPSVGGIRAVQKR